MLPHQMTNAELIRNYHDSDDPIISTLVKRLEETRKDFTLLAEDFKLLEEAFELLEEELEEMKEQEQ